MHTGCMVVSFSIPAFCIVGIIECYCMHIGCMDGYLFHREDIHGNCVRAEVPPDLLESAEKDVPGTSVSLGTPAIMGGKTALQSS